MKKTKNVYKTLAAAGCLLLTLVSCEKDFSTIESEIEGIKNFTTTGNLFPAVMYTKKLNPVQTNNLSSNLLGIYTDNIYGKTTANVVTQVVPASFQFNFGEEPQVESVYLTIPYYSTVSGTDDEGNDTYTLDSIFGGNESVKLSIYENTYFIRDFDPSSEQTEAQKFYSNANETINFDNYTGQLFSVLPEHVPSPSAIPIEEFNEETGEEEETSRLAPSLYVRLDNSTNFWDDLFFFNTENPGSQPELSNQNNFKNYFRGLYFKVEDNNNKGNMAMMDFSRGTIVINYSSLTETVLDENGNPEEIREDRKITLNLSGNRVNTIENDANVKAVIENATANTDVVNGANAVYLKGGEGSFAVVDLFSGTTQDASGATVPALEYFKSKKDNWIINQANLTVFVNQNEVNNANQEPERVILYDLKNNVPIIDYYLDTSVNTTQPINSRINYASRLKRDSNNKGLYYKLRLTEHVNNILLRDSTNLKLGILITSNINLTTNGSILNNVTDKIPTSSILSPRGTVLYGSNPSVPETKKVKFEIFYTEPNK
ncbi:DUF4270 domain-containing protein [Bizionia sediminis]|uniref:DUF4270 domain-containing protein n=1 Tax=Bizionia sediminis TaxID=1737064 RepID=A0ABW5KSI3_9FLAO